MPILNYTTTIKPERSISEITRSLVLHGATRVLVEYSKDRQPVSLSFTIETKLGQFPFRLPARIDGVKAALAREWAEGKIPRAKTGPEHASRVAWRILKDWIEAQMALIEAGLVTVDEIMLPYMIIQGDRTVFQAVSEQRLAITAPRG